MHYRVKNLRSKVEKIFQRGGVVRSVVLMVNEIGTVLVRNLQSLGYSIASLNKKPYGSCFKF